MKIRNCLSFLFMMVVFTSCEKVIDVDLNSAEKKYVIEAVLTNQPNTSYVEITQTADFDQSNNFPKVSGATVRMAESGGTTVALSETQPGRYEAPGLVGTSGKRYSLSVIINGTEYTAQSTMPAAINLDTIFLTNELLFDQYRRTLNIEHVDPAGIANSYRYIMYKNNTRKGSLFIRNDEYSDGRYMNSKLFLFGDDDDDDVIQTGDELKVDMLCLDPVIYKYWFSLIRSSTGSSQQATPANPVSNMLGGALGYFSAHTLQTKTMIAD